MNESPQGTWLKTARLTLRRPVDADVEAIFDIHSDPRTYEHAPHLVMRDRSQASARLADWRQDWADRGFGYAVVMADGGDGVAGFCGVRPEHVAGRDVLNLYYRFAPAAWGSGYAAEAASAVVDWAMRTHPSTPVVARITRNSHASQHVAERIGLVQQSLQDPDDDIPHWIYASGAI